MSLADIKLYLKSITPYQFLTENQLDKIINNTDIVYLKENKQVEDTKNNIYIVLKGLIVEIDKEGKEVEYYPKDATFDIKSIKNGNSENIFIAKEEAILYKIPKAIIKQIFEENKEFQNYFLKSLSERLSSLSQTDTYLFSKIKDIPFSKPVILDKNLPIIEAVKEMDKQKSTSIIVDFGESYGIITDSDLRKKVIIAQKDINLPIKEIANKNLISVNIDDFLFDAIMKMIKHNIKRVVIEDKGKIVGILNETDLLTLYSNQPQFLALKIEKASSLEEVKNISEGMINVVNLLLKEGIRIRHIMKFVTEINIKIYKKVFNLLADEEIKNNVALIIMGSEGRKEQILKTDQDNGLILKDGFNKDLEEFANKFTQSLIYLGYPPCDGNVMVSNKEFRKKLSEYKEDISKWIDKPEKYLNLSIMIDMLPVDGEEYLAEELREYIFDVLNENRLILSHFALPVLQFKTPLSIFGTFIKEEKDKIDIKKGGIFPIVHGIRTLAVEYRIKETNTFERIKQLSEKNLFNREFARELIEAYEFMQTLRLKAKIKKIKANEKPDNYINLKDLSNIEADMLKDCFKIVNKFKDFITNHYKLNYIS